MYSVGQKVHVKSSDLFNGKLGTVVETDALDSVFSYRVRFEPSAETEFCEHNNWFGGDEVVSAEPARKKWDVKQGDKVRFTDRYSGHEELRQGVGVVSSVHQHGEHTELYVTTEDGGIAFLTGNPDVSDDDVYLLGEEPEPFTVSEPVQQEFEYDRVEIHIGGVRFQGSLEGEWKNEHVIVGPDGEQVSLPAGEPPVAGWRMYHADTSKRRKEQPVFTGFVQYFPAAMALVAELSRLGNEKHNPGQPLHHARGKSMDHGDCIVRHQATYTDIDKETEMVHAVAVAWRAMAQLQELAESQYGWPKAPAAK